MQKISPKIIYLIYLKIYAKRKMVEVFHYLILMNQKLKRILIQKINNYNKNNKKKILIAKIN